MKKIESDLYYFANNIYRVCVMGLSEKDLAKVFVLNIYLDDKSKESPLYRNTEIVKKYKEAISNRQQEVLDYLSNSVVSGRGTDVGSYSFVDSGFDIICPTNLIINEKSLSNKINHGIKCSMTYQNNFCGYYLYSRSSTGSKTPLRLSNSVGIIDAGYRGNIMSLFDNRPRVSYEVKKGDRLSQICGPNLICPIWPNLVENESDLVMSKRGSGGFGSTGR
jgi:dUTP pyrophosphatase